MRISDWSSDVCSSDLALYHAKSDGRGIYRHFDLDLQKKIDHRLDMERTLREALAEDQFELHYQPIVSAQKPQVVGFEALIRWDHPTRGRMSPAEFIPVAEEVGLIADIGAWVLRSEEHTSELQSLMRISY